jgi:hypothetical protein
VIKELKLGVREVIKGLKPTLVAVFPKSKKKVRGKPII